MIVSPVPPSIEALDASGAIALARKRSSTVVVYWAGGSVGRPIATDDADAFYQCLRHLPRQAKIDLVLNTDGGAVHAARKMAMLLRHYAAHLTVWVPFRARSSGTLICLAADEIVLGPAGELSPLDANIAGPQGAPGAAPEMISSEDIRHFRTLAENWFGLTQAEDRAKVFAMLSERFFPSTLASFYRADTYVRTVATELAAFNLRGKSEAARAAVVERLISSYPQHAHGFLTRDLQAFGLNCRAAEPEEDTWLHALWDACAGYLGADKSKPRGPSTPSALIWTEGAFARHLPRQMIVAPERNGVQTRPVGAEGGWEIVRGE